MCSSNTKGSTRMLAPPPLWLQKPTDLHAHNFAHSPCLWHEPRLTNWIYAWSWRLCGSTRTVPRIPPVCHGLLFSLLIECVVSVVVWSCFWNSLEFQCVFLTLNFQLPYVACLSISSTRVFMILSLLQTKGLWMSHMQWSMLERKGIYVFVTIYLQGMISPLIGVIELMGLYRWWACKRGKINICVFRKEVSEVFLLSISY